MAAVTKYNKPKPFSWSFSRLKNFSSCAHRYYRVDVLKDVREEQGEALTFGNEVHKLLAEYLVGKRDKLPPAAAEYQSWADKVKGDGTGELYVEQKLAITEDFRATGFFDKDVWFRSIADVIKIVGPVALLIDWKLGKVLDDSQQLALGAACVFAKFPQVKRIRAEFVWLKYDATTRDDFSREDMPGVWKNIFPRIEQLKQAHETNQFPPRENGLCKKWCPVLDCRFNGANE